MLVERVLYILSQGLNVAPETLNAQASPQTVENWDSLRHLNLILAIEEDFGITFEDGEIVHMQSVPAIIDALRKHGVEE